MDGRKSVLLIGHEPASYSFPPLWVDAARSITWIP